MNNLIYFILFLCGYISGITVCWFEYRDLRNQIRDLKKEKSHE